MYISSPRNITTEHYYISIPYLTSTPLAIPVSKKMSQPPPRILRIAMLNADVPVPTIAPIYPTYGRIFHELLTKAAQTINPQMIIQSIDFEVQKSQYPESLALFDALIISGSASSAYDNQPWIHTLHSYVQHVYTHFPHVKIYGSCFGHQIICSALLGGYGVRVEQDPRGWEIGVHEITFHQDFLAAFPWDGTEKKGGAKEKEQGEKGGMKLQFIHHDHVVLPTPTSIPSGWITVGRTDHCAVQGMYKPGRVFTLQGHFEFDRVVNAEVIKYFFGQDWDADRIEEVLRRIDADDDAGEVAGLVSGFLMGARENEVDEVEGQRLGMIEDVDWERQRMAGVVSA
jgi:GMP synthase-like glutamine amidotransferase